MKTTPETLFQRFRAADDVAALARVFDALAPDLFAIARHLARGEGEAEDFVQATFLVAIERSQAFHSGHRLLPWMLGILVRHARKVRRQEGREVDPEGLHVAQGRDPVREAEDAELREAVGSALARLPRRDARLLELYFTQGLRPSQLAELLRVSPGAARVRLHRGLKRLRKALPAGFAAGAAVAALPRRGLASVRAEVVHAAGGTGAPLAGVAGAGLALKLGGAAAIVVSALGVGWARWPGGEPEARRTGDAQALALAEPEGPDRADVPHHEAQPLQADRLAAPARDARAALAAARQHDPDAATVRGRFLSPGGAPATGVQVRLRGEARNDARAREHGIPEDWEDPPAVETDSGGRFALTLVPPRAFEFVLDAELEGYVAISWRWREIEPGQTLDLGDVTLARGGTLLVRVVDSAGNALVEGWSVSASEVLARGGARVAWRGRNEVNAAWGEARIEGVRPGRVELEARGPAQAFVEGFADVAAAGVTRAELRYLGPALAERVLVYLRNRPFSGFMLPDAGQVVLRSPDGSTRTSEKHPRATGCFAFDEVGPGPCTIQVTDPRYLAWSRSGVAPGDELRADLVGSATIVLRVEDAETGEELTGYGLAVRYPEASFLPNGVELLAPGAPPPAGGRFEGIVPGECALEVRVPGYPLRDVPVPNLAPGEERVVVVRVARGVSLAGQVLDAQGRPARDVRVQLTPGPRAGHTLGTLSSVRDGKDSVPPVLEEARSAADGSFAFAGAGPGQWTVRALWSPWLVADRTLTFDAPTQVELHAPPSGLVAGRVLVPEGVDAASVLVRASVPSDAWLQGNGMLEGAEPLGAGGTFRLGPLPVGEANLLYSVPSRVTAYTEFALGTVTILAGEVVQGEFDSRDGFPGDVRLAVRIDGTPATRGYVAVEPWEGGPMPIGLRGAPIDPYGTCIAGSLDPGEKRLEFLSYDGGWSCAHPEPVEVAPGRETRLELDFALVPRTALFLDGASGEPLAKETVRWWPTDDPLPSDRYLPRAPSGTTDAEGRLELAVPAGAVLFFFLDEVGPAVRAVWEGGPEPLVVRLPARD